MSVSKHFYYIFLVCHNFRFTLSSSVSIKRSNAILDAKDISSMASVGTESVKEWQKDYKNLDKVAK